MSISCGVAPGVGEGYDVEVDVNGQTASSTFSYQGNYFIILIRVLNFILGPSINSSSAVATTGGRVTIFGANFGSNATAGSVQVLNFQF